MSDFESIEGSGLSEQAEEALENESEEELERLVYEDEEKFRGESSKKKKLRREMERESMARLERLAKTEEDFKEVVKQWDRLEKNSDRRFRYHEAVRGDVPLEYGMAEDSPVIPAFLNNAYWKAIRSGNYMELIFDCPFEIDQVTSHRYISGKLRDLKDEYKELLYYLVIREYSTAHLAEILDQTDRNIRKKQHRLLERLRRKLYEHLDKRERRGSWLTKREQDFLLSRKNQKSDTQQDGTEEM